MQVKYTEFELERDYAQNRLPPGTHGHIGGTGHDQNTQAYCFSCKSASVFVTAKQTAAYSNADSRDTGKCKQRCEPSSSVERQAWTF